ncbi:MAG: AI-2E family transporter [endosymbiont of Galathealinum brachiosum]|uniref:AI-2E family transporter n=1 Tax=endosymbiont of Galathealinum brachiosum TaxID=2200906 RepID=A0A370D9M2_9GAMM|nr:MAG: AI-2E family transporter [endosymbiont of Galathealinum brachiosum]
MIEVLRVWYNRHFSDPQAVILALMLIFGFALIAFMGNVLTPVIAAVVIAYVLEGVVRRLCNFKVPHVLAVSLVVVSFVVTLLILMLGLSPLISKQLTQFFLEVPGMLTQGQNLLISLPKEYPFISETQIQDIVSHINTELASVGQLVVSRSLSSVVNLFTVLVYMVVVPLLVFFFLKDKDSILNWLSRFLPKEDGLATKVWRDVDKKIGSYIRGKLFEVGVVGIATYIPLKIFDLQYAALLSLFVGLSVIIPYVGAVAVTIPVALIAYFQFGMGSEFFYIMLAYLIIQFLDGNLLVPLLFSEVVNMHPSAIIMSVLVFGGLWGIWGVFFAIPLATLIQAVINAWPEVTA